MVRNKRKNNMNTAKLGVIFIVAAMALAAIGAGYSAWFDTITVEGTVSTGDVDLEVIDYSGTWVYKDLNAEDDSIEVIDRGWVSTATYTQTMLDGTVAKCTRDLTDGFLLVAYSYSDYYADDEVTMVYGNLFPCIDFVADILFHYDGSIPGKVNDYGLPDIYGDGADPYVTGNWMPGLIGMFNDIPIPDIFVVAFRCDDNGNPIDADGNWLIYDDLYENAGNYDAYEIVTIGTQLHKSNWFKLELHIHIPQTDDSGAMTEWLMSRDGGFTATIGIVQWNEFPYEGGECGEDPIIGHNADVMLTIDTSGSIGGDAGTVQTAAKAFVTALLAPDNGQVGIVNFDDGAWLKSTFSMVVTDLHDIIDLLTFVGPATNLAAGISLSQNELATADREPDTHADPTQAFPDYMVIITDGEPTKHRWRWYNRSNSCQKCRDKNICFRYWNHRFNIISKYCKHW